MFNSDLLPSHHLHSHFAYTKKTHTEKRTNKKRNKQTNIEVLKLVDETWFKTFRNQGKPGTSWNYLKIWLSGLDENPGITFVNFHIFAFMCCSFNI